MMVSLRLRLALLYGGLTGLVVLLVAVVTYAIHSRAHYDELDRVLSDAADHIAAEYRPTLSPDAITQMLARPIAGDVVARFYDADGSVIAGERTARPVPPIDPRRVGGTTARRPYDPIIALAPSIMPNNTGPGEFGLVDDADGEHWRVYVLPVEGSARWLVVAAPLANIDEMIDRFRLEVIVLALGAAAVTLAAGWLIAGRALRPVAILTAIAGNIAHSRRFSQRVPNSGRRDEMGQLAATFNEMLDSLEQVYRHQQRFVSDASHELRAPLTAIQANLDLLERQSAMPEAERQEALAEASREANRLARLVADLLALARADAGVPLRRERVDLDRVLLEALSDARHLGRGQQFAVTTLEPVVVEGDGDRLKQLLLILLDNAVKYTPPNGSVSLSLIRDGTSAEVVVRDTGIGIRAEELPHVFERFYRADPARSRDPGGTGLGLAIARWIVGQHHGVIELESPPGGGTAARVRLPIAR